MEKILRDSAGNQSKLSSRFSQLLLRTNGGIDRAMFEWEKDMEEQMSWEEWRRMSLAERKFLRNTAVSCNTGET